MKRSSLFGSLLLTLWMISVPSAAAQWNAQLEIGSDRYWGGSVETTPEHRSFKPYRPTVFGLGLERRQNALGLGVRLRYLEAALGLEGEGAMAAVEGVFKVVSLSPEVTYRVTTVGPVSELRLHAGPTIERWDIIDEGANTRIGAQTAVSLSIPLGGRFTGSLLMGVSVTPSPFDDGQLGETFDTRPLWCRRVTGALQYRL